MAVTVRIYEGSHGMKTPAGMQALLEEFISQAGLEGEVTVHLGEKTKGRPHRQGVQGLSVGPLINGRHVVLTAQPGGNDTCHKIRLVVPQGWGDPEDVRVKLLSFAEGAVEEEEERAEVFQPVETPVVDDDELTYRGLIEAADSELEGLGQQAGELAERETRLAEEIRRLQVEQLAVTQQLRQLETRRRGLLREREEAEEAIQAAKERKLDAARKAIRLLPEELRKELLRQLQRGEI